MSELKLKFVNLKPEYAEDLAEMQRIAFPTVPADMLFSAEEYETHAKLFPEGTFVALHNGRPVGVGSGIFVDFDFNHPQHTLVQMMGGDGHCRSHNPQGMYYYGVDINVHPDYRRHGIGRKLYELRKSVTRRYNKKGIIAGGVLPNYGEYKAQMGPLEYVNRVTAGEIYDRTLTFQIQNGFQVLGVLSDYFPDGPSCGYASFIYWENPDYRAPQPVRRLPRPVWPGAGGWMMPPAG